VCRWRLGFGVVGIVWRLRLDSREAKGLGFGAGRFEMVWLENGDGGGEGNPLRFYAAITIPEMPLCEVEDGN
jgi:hypothetical protein